MCSPSTPEDPPQPHWSTAGPDNRFAEFKFLPVCRNQVDHDVVRESQCSPGDGMVGTAYCGVTVIQNVLLSGRAFNKLFVFGEFAGEISFVKVAEDNN